MNSPPTEPKLADPAERPDCDIVIYDGSCRFCTKQVQRLARWDRGERLSFLSLHDTRVTGLCPDLTPQELLEQIFVLTAQGERFGGASAARYLSRRLPRLWMLAPLLHLPGTLGAWQWVYRQIAKRRYRFGRVDPCESDSCDVHSR